MAHQQVGLDQGKLNEVKETSSESEKVIVPDASQMYAILQQQQATLHALQVLLTANATPAATTVKTCLTTHDTAEREATEQQTDADSRLTGNRIPSSKLLKEIQPKPT